MDGGWMRASEELDLVFGALADPTRRAIVERLTNGHRLAVTELAADFPISLNAVSKHLKVLERSGLLRREIEGRVHYCSLAPTALQTPAEWIRKNRKFWETRLDALGAFMRDRTRTGAAPREKRR
jgi:DNA-binding transcriptional ArsR family regulator